MKDQLFVGIDVSKNTFDVATVPASTHREFDNDQSGIAGLVKWLRKAQPALVVMEATGGYQQELELALWDATITFATVNPKRVRDFAKSDGKLAKTDRIDAAMIALYADRMRPEPTPEPDPAVLRLSKLVLRRRQVQKMIQQENNRLETATEDVAQSINRILECCRRELDDLEKQIDGAAEATKTLKDKSRILRSMPGVGRVFTFTALADLDELGRVCEKSIAALVGVAPFNCDSGRMQGKRFCWGGRGDVRRVLYMAALSATRHNPVIREFYQRLLTNGKDKMVAIVACMRKLLVILNAMIRDGKEWDPKFSQNA